jgi:hypothetical protein
VGNAHANVLEDTGEELKIGELDCINTNIFAQLNHNEFLLGGLTWGEHVLVLCTSKDRYSRLSELVHGLYACVALARGIVEAVDEGNMGTRERRRRDSESSSIG